MGPNLSDTGYIDFTTTFPLQVILMLYKINKQKDCIKISECVKMLCNLQIYIRMVDVSYVTCTYYKNITMNRRFIIVLCSMMPSLHVIFFFHSVAVLPGYS